jgi:hypothetical protein
MSFNPAFIGVNSIGESLLLNELINNYKSFLEWGFLNIGGFTNVHIPTNNIHNFNLHTLKPTKDPNNTSYTVWQSPRKDWVYESGISFSGLSPINISGVYVNSSFYPAPTGNGSLGYKINYPEGKVIFNSPVSQSSTVTAEYSYRNVQIYKMEEFPYFREVQQNSLENKTGFNFFDKNDFSISSEKRIQLPAIVIEPVARSNSKPLQLGNISQIVEQDLLFHILCDNNKDKNNIIDIFRLQKDRIIYLYNTDNIVKDGAYSLNYDGSKNINGQNYNILVNNDNYKWIECRLSNVAISDIYFNNIQLYGAVVRVTNELIFIQNDNSSYC